MMRCAPSEAAELSRRGRSTARVRYERSATQEKDQPHKMEDDEDIPGDFDRHPYGWAASYPQTAGKPLIDYCTNEWQINPMYITRSASPPLDHIEASLGNFFDRCLAILKSRKLRRHVFFCTVLILVSWYIWRSKISPTITENRLLTQSLTQESSPSSLGMFGKNHPPTFPGMIHLKRMDEKFLPRSQAVKRPDLLNTRRLIFVGDIHGCKDDLVALLDRVQFNPKLDHLITTGDLISKGPDPLGTLNLVRKMEASCVRGNHDDRILLIAQDLNSTGLHSISRNPEDFDYMDEQLVSHSNVPERALASSLDADQLSYLQSCPVILKVGSMKALGGEILVVHAGLVPGISLEVQDPTAAMNMRTIDLDTHVPSKVGKEGPSKGNRGTISNLVHWVKLWNKYQKMLPTQMTLFPSSDPETQKKKEQHTTVIYGHDSKRGLQLQRYTKGIDTGCVNGGKLTALVMTDGGVQYIKQVKCQNHRAT